MPPHDAAGFSNAIDRLVEDEYMRQELGRRAPERVQQRSLQQCLSRLVEIPEGE
jgi:hypothetical protein